MRAKEFINESRLTEQMLTEVDWNKVKSAILGGVLSLSALGAPNLQARDIQTMSGEEIKQYVIQNSTVKNKQEILDVINMLGQDRNREQALTTQPTAKPVATPAPAAKPVVAPPVKTVATPAPSATAPVTSTTPPSATPATPAQPPVATPVAKPAATPPPAVSTSPSDFSVKGLQWGMTLDQVIAITGATENDLSQRYDPATGQFPKKPATSWSQALDNFSIGGFSSWYAEKDQSNTLQGMTVFPRSEYVDDALRNFTAKYGKPKILQYKARTKGGLELDVFNAEWKLPGAVITMNNHIDRDKGYIKIQSVDSYNKEQQRSKEQKDKAAKDFE